MDPTDATDGRAGEVASDATGVRHASGTAADRRRRRADLTPAFSGARVVRDALRRRDGERAATRGDGDAADHAAYDTRRRDAVVLVVVLVVGCGVLAVTLLRGGDGPGGVVGDGAVPAAVVPDPTAVASSVLDPTAVASSVSADEMRVHVAGAVQRPGVYRLAPGSRGEDAVAAAGGALPGAHVDGVNLAAEVRDGQQLTVPATPTSPAGSDGVEGTDPGGSTASGGGDPVPLDLNVATAEQLDALPGVGPSTAERIIAHRRRRRFGSVRELLEVPGIGDARYAQLRDLVTV